MKNWEWRVCRLLKINAQGSNWDGRRPQDGDDK